MQTSVKILVVLSLALLPAATEAAKCPPDSVQVGPVCVDTYEASIWNIPATNQGGNSNAGLIKKVQKGIAKLADLSAGGATEVSPAPTTPIGLELPPCGTTP